MTKDKRTEIRFPSEDNTVAWISRDTEKFQEDISALIENESHEGCCLITHRLSKPAVGEKYLIKVGEVGPHPAQVKWTREIGEGLFKVGFQILD